MRKTSEERKKEIWQAGKEVFLEKGYDKATMEDIISRTSLSKGGLYHYYRRPKDILFDIMRYHNEAYLEIDINQKILQEETCPHKQLDKLLDAIIDKMCRPTPERKLFAIFMSLIPFDPEVEAEYKQLQQSFLKGLCHRLAIENKGDKHQQLLFMSRWINGVTFFQNILPEPDRLMRNKDSLRKMMKEELMLLMQKEEV
ncbi:TetR/AcrR family transcriptional regulator [Tindallia californiensis]|uniref:DNA-binding transcriptional regulator, AcrR family n=1 Tax=Tindallia californiensis TaxID=159292 RepID=A0A1H3QDW0_9FIRM|nr:TetR/AcrR family transcriptional regulator [Tindallia californiensis]SDZ11453.1 DNA-binding transcriptional regulator, AcrR family [Tindallia californiensis]